MTTIDAVFVNNGNENDSRASQSHQPPEEDFMKYFDKYDMTHKKRGVAYIFNNVNFRSSSLPTRHGSTKDKEDFKKALIKLGFYAKDISVYDDLTAKEMLDCFEQFDQTDRDIDCFICAILSHSDENDNMYGYEGFVKLEKLLSCLKPDRCRSLRGVPKLIFIEANRGSKIDPGIEKEDAVCMRVEESSLHIPTSADMLVVFSSSAGYPSFIDETKGSWFMQALSTILEIYGIRYEIIKLLTAVFNSVASRKYESSVNSEFEGCKQMPCFVSTLTKELMFKPNN